MSSLNNRQRNSKTQSKLKGYPPVELHTEKILVVVKTAPQPSVAYKEIVCTAGITKNGKWIRLYPIEYRYLDFFKRYKKYQWIEVEIEKNFKDLRVDSYRPRTETIRVIGKELPAGKWIERKKIILPTVSANFEIIKMSYEANKVSLGIFKPRKITEFIIEDDDKNWSVRHQKILGQQVLFGKQPKRLEKIPFKFSYRFLCNSPSCKSHKMQIVDWEVYELYRTVKENHPYAIDVVLEKVKKKWLYEMWSEKRDSYLIVGSRYPFPTFVVLGVFWPPKNKLKSL